MQKISLIALASCLLFSGCAYFNTYYNAESSFNAGYTEHRKIMRDNPDSLVKPTGTILTNYDRAITKGEKMLEVYPKDKKWPDDAIFIVGKANLYKGEFIRAIRKFRQLQDEYPGSPHIPQSFLLMGQAYLHDGDLTKAEEILTMVQTKYPHLNNNEEISLLLAKIAIKREGKMQAIELLDKVKNAGLSDDKRIELIIQLAQLNIDLKQYDKAIDLLANAPKNKKLVRQMFRIQTLLLDCYFKTDSFPAALTLCNTMLKNPEFARFEARLQLRKAAILNRLGKTREAIALYETITERGDTSSAAKEAWFELGIIYQQEKGDFVKAKECYNKAIASSDTMIARVARKNIAALTMIDSLRSKKYTTMPKDTAAAKDSLYVPAYREFKIGELFWLELGQADSAFGTFTALARDSARAGSMQSKALYAAGYIALNSLKDTIKADSLFSILTTRYPDNAFSQRAQIDRGKPVTIQLRGDLALDSLIAAEKKYILDSDPAGAVEAYLRIVQNFPDIPEIASKSLFAAAWVCDEVLFKKKTAKTLYEKICADFPSSEYCTSGARPRLKAVLDSMTSRNLNPEEKQQKSMETPKQQIPAQDSIRPMNNRKRPGPSDPQMQKMPSIPQPYSRGVPPPPPSPVPTVDSTPLSPAPGTNPPVPVEEVIDSIH